MCPMPRAKVIAAARGRDIRFESGICLFPRNFSFGEEEEDRSERMQSG